MVPTSKFKSRFFTSFLESLDSSERTVRGYEADGPQEVWNSLQRLCRECSCKADGPPRSSGQPARAMVEPRIGHQQTIRRGHADGPPVISWICPETNSALSKLEYKRQTVRPVDAEGLHGVGQIDRSRLHRRGTKDASRALVDGLLWDRGRSTRVGISVDPGSQWFLCMCSFLLPHTTKVVI